MSKTNIKEQKVSSVKTRNRFEVKTPKNYKIILLNNNTTSFEAVVDVLKTIFNKSKAEATAIMFHAHTTGIALVEAPVTKDIGTAKIKQAEEYCKKRDAEMPNYTQFHLHNYNHLMFELHEED